MENQTRRRSSRLGDLASGLIDARMSGVTFWDTDAGRRLLESRGHARKAAAPPPAAQATAERPAHRRVHVLHRRPRRRQP